MTYRAGTIKRQRRTKAQVEQLDEQILEVLREDNPQSVRHIFYRMTDPRLPEPVEKSEKGYRHVQYRTKELRRQGRLPYGWITDATRRGYFVPTYRDKSEFLRRMAGFYRHDLWQESPYYVEVWTESRSIAGVVEDLCEELAVSLYPAGGFSSISLAYEASESINNTVFRTGKCPVVLFVGDYDPAGVLIDKSLEEELRRHLDGPLSFHRLAITQEQIEDYDLPTKPRKAGDKRARHIEETVEAEAMPANLLRTLLRDAVEAYLPAQALAVAKVAEREERDGLRLLADYLEDSA